MDEALPTLAVFGVAVIRLVPAAGRITAGANKVRFYAPSVAIVHEEWRRARQGASDFRRLDSGPPIAFRRQIEFESVGYQ